MKRTPMPQRSAPMDRGKGLERGAGPVRRVPLRAVSAARSAERALRLGAALAVSVPQAVRDTVFDRDLGWCVRCGRALIRGRGGYSVHHRVLRSHGTDNSPQNLVLLCGSGTTACHGWVHANPARATAAGWMLPGNQDSDPAAEPVLVAEPDGPRWFLLLADGTRCYTGAPERAAA